MKSRLAFRELIPLSAQTWSELPNVIVGPHYMRYSMVTDVCPSYVRRLSVVYPVVLSRKLSKIDPFTVEQY